MKALGEYKGGGEIVFLGKPTTKTRLHELAHKELGHEPGWYSIKEFINNELDAETWALDKMGKKPSYRIGLIPYSELIDRFGVPPVQAYALVRKVLRSRGIPLPREMQAFYADRT